MKQEFKNSQGKKKGNDDKNIHVANLIRQFFSRIKFNRYFLLWPIFTNNDCHFC